MGFAFFAFSYENWYLHRLFGVLMLWIWPVVTYFFIIHTNLNNIPLHGINPKPGSKAKIIGL
ncbi:MAG: hypothetical protein DRH90_12720 [Deltaproteobacteria bacterium]|nr:MAG: hypothetical protein DRH90_12720 [Deltaproteobacteria bacterium]